MPAACACRASENAKHGLAGRLFHRQQRRQRLGLACHLQQLFGQRLPLQRDAEVADAQGCGQAAQQLDDAQQEEKVRGEPLDGHGLERGCLVKGIHPACAHCRVTCCRSMQHGLREHGQQHMHVRRWQQRVIHL